MGIECVTRLTIQLEVAPISVNLIQYPLITLHLITKLENNNIINLTEMTYLVAGGSWLVRINHQIPTRSYKDGPC